MKKILSRKTITFSLLFLIIVTSIYIFFFLSKAILPASISSKDMTTKIGQKYDYSSNRSYSLVSCSYSKDDQEMEIVITLDNKSYDGINDYFVVAEIAGKNKVLEVKTFMNEPLISVFKIKNLKKFDEINFYVAPKISDVNKISDDDTAFIILNKHNVKKVDKIATKTKEEYMMEKLQSSIDTYQEKLEKAQKANSDLEKNKKNLLDEINKIEESKTYLTADEFFDAEIKITENKKEIEDIDLEIYKKTNFIERLKNNKAESERKLEKLKVN